MKRNELLLAGFVFLLGSLVTVYSVLAGVSFSTTPQSRIYRTNMTAGTPIDTTGTVYCLPFKCGATPGAASTLYSEGDANAYASVRMLAQRQTNGVIRFYVNGSTTYPETLATGVDANVPQLLTWWIGPKSGSDANAMVKAWLNGNAVTTGYPGVVLNDANYWTTCIGSSVAQAAAGFTGEIEGLAIAYSTDPNAAGTIHAAVWNSGDVLEPNAAVITPYTWAHRWRLTGGTPGDAVVGTDVWLDDVASGADGSFSFDTRASGDANWPKYTATWLITPTTLTVADSNNVTFTGPCVGPWTGGLTYSISGDSTSWTVLAQDANDTWWAADPNAGTENGDVVIGLTADANALSLGTYTSTIVFANADTGGLGDTTRTITLTVWEPNAIALTDPNHSTGYTWTFPYGGSDANSFVTGITNGALCEYVCNVTLSDPNWTLAVPDPNFCTPDGSGGYDCNLPAADNIAFTAELDPNVMPTMPIGAYASSLVFKPAGDTDPNHARTIPLTVNVVAGSVIDPNDRVWAWIQTGDANDVDVTEKTVTFTNTGASGNIVFAFSDPNTLDLISLSALCTYTPGLGLTCPIDHDGNVVVTLAPNATSAAGLGAGAYSDTLMIYPEGDSSSPLEIQTVLNVTTMSADYYVANTGTDTTSGGQGTSIDKPWRTIAYAISNATTGKTIVVIGDTYTDPAGYVGIGSGANGKTLTVQADGTVTLSNATYGIYAGSAWTSGTLTFKDMTVSGASTATLLYDLGAGTSHLKLEDCTITGGSRTGLMIAAGTATTSHNVTLTNCTIGAPVAGYDAVSVSRDIATCKLVNCTVTAGTNNGVAVASAVTAGQAIIDGGTYDGTNCGASKAVIQWDTSNTYDLVAVRNATITAGRAGINLSRGVTTGIVEGCTVTGVGANAVRLITIGQDASTAPVNPVLTAYCRNNTCTYSGAGVSHAILIGNGVTGGEVTGNTTNAGDYAIVCKADGVAIHHNVLANSTTGGLGGVYFRCAHDCTLAYNTIVARAGDGVIGDTQAGGTAPARNVVAHNIVYVTGAANYRVNEATASVFGTWVFDDNLYYGGKAAYIGAAKNALTDLQAYWAATATRSWNEETSIEADPLFYGSNDFRVRSLLARGAGTIAAPGIGAHAGAKTTAGSRNGRIGL